MPPYLKGHYSKNQAVRRAIRRSQRQATKLFPAGKATGGTKKKPKRGEKVAKVYPAYPCGPKQMSLGEVIPGNQP